MTDVYPADVISPPPRLRVGIIGTGLIGKKTVQKISGICKKVSFGSVYLNLLTP